ncbi:MAG: multidrug ABC transporter ATP-binding protein [Myxococcales bacterium]|nr:multidrug ABC transporter ATP-binding protein [Myxococcales bacterium]
MTASPTPRDPCPLRLDGVVKRFGDFTAVRDVTLTIDPGEIFALLGPNGAGKTTLIRCVAGLARQSVGAISVFGFDTVTEFRQTRRLLGLVPQELNFDPFFTPHQSLMIQMGLMGVTPDAAWADQLLETFALTDHRDAYTRHLSGGMKRRLLVAKALVHRPRLLFLDEPTAGVDVELRKDLWAEVRRLREQGTTIILTTHYLEEAEELADRIGVIHKGRLLLVEERDALMHSRRRPGQALLDLAAPLDQLPEGLPPGAELRRGGRQLCSPWSDPEELERTLRRVREVARIIDLQVERTRLEDIFVELIAEAEQR